MKRKDLIFILASLAFFAPFFLSEKLYQTYVDFNSEHGMIMSFIKFAILATYGEVIGLRIRTGSYNQPGFGIIPRAIVWGFLGLTIKMAFTIFTTGTLEFLSYLGWNDVRALFAGPFSLSKAIIAFCISVLMNSIYAPVMMTLHKITDMHILNTGGTVRGLFTPIPFRKIFPAIDWETMWNFVFKKTIPLFWFPAHTVTFLLPPDWQVLFAALLGVALGIILAVAKRK